MCIKNDNDIVWNNTEIGWTLLYYVPSQRKIIAVRKISAKIVGDENRCIEF